MKNIKNISISVLSIISIVIVIMITFYFNIDRIFTLANSNTTESYKFLSETYSVDIFIPSTGFTTNIVIQDPENFEFETPLEVNILFSGSLNEILNLGIIDIEIIESNYLKSFKNSDGSYIHKTEQGYWFSSPEGFLAGGGSNYLVVLQLLNDTGEEIGIRTIPTIYLCQDSSVQAIRLIGS